jgi:hypothetical protein
MPLGAKLWGHEDWLEKLKRERSNLQLRAELVERQIRLTQQRIRTLQSRGYHPIEGPLCHSGG